jgi:hypothetical protein
MRHHLTALLLLLIFGGSLFASPHPCHQARGAEPDSAQVSPPGEPAGRYGCHGAVQAAATGHEGHGAPAPASGGNAADPCGDEKGGCKHACHMVAVVGARVALFAVEPQAQMVPPTFDRSLPLFAPPIDHIPLV